MLGLLYKDFCILKKKFLLLAVCAVALSILLFIPWGNGNAAQEINGVPLAQMMTYVHFPMITYFMLFCIVSGIQTDLFAHDERKMWSHFMTASPLGDKEQVLSKYFMTLGMSFAIVVWGYICDIICSLTTGYAGSASNIYLTFFYIQIILQAIEYPFIIRFGHKHGNTYKVAMIVVAFYGVMIYLLFGKFPENFSMDTVFELCVKLMMNETALSTAMLGVLALLPYVAGLLFYLSYKLSCKWYRKGVESYEG